MAYKESKSVGVTTAAAAACNLITDLAAIRWIGLYAASGSTLISYIFLFIYRIRDVQRIVRIKYDLRHMIIVLSLMVVEGVLCFQQKTALNLLNLLFGTVIFFAINRSFVRTVWTKLRRMVRRKR